MSAAEFTTIGKNGQTYVCKFDHEEARARFALGEETASIARGYGVSWSAVKRVVDPQTRKKMDARARANIEARRVPCRGGCARLVWMHGARPRTGYCPKCLGEKTNVVRHGTETEYSQGCRCGKCLTAASAAKRRRRENSRIPCSHGCGTLVDGINRGWPDKPPECRPCYYKRQRGELSL